MSFFAPIFLPLLALASVPIIIHLLNRRRFQTVEWAPMKYLKLTIKTNRRRLRIEQLILLAVRTLVVILIILAVARPVLSGGALGGWLAGRSRVSRILVIDDSLSTGYRDAGRSAFENAKDVAAHLLKSIGPQDAVTALVTSSASDPIVKEAHLDDASKVVAAVSGLSATDAATDWAAVLKGVDQAVATATFPTKEVVIVTDLRKSGWSSGVTEITQRWAGQSVTMKIIDVGTRQTANVALTSVELEDPIALVGGPINLRAQVRNDTPAAVTGAQALL